MINYFSSKNVSLEYSFNSFFFLISKYNDFIITYLAIRGGIVNCSHRMSIANNPYCPNYEEKEEMRTIMWYDVNNLYGFAMHSYLPLREFEFVEDVDIQTILNTADDADYGYMVRTFSLLIIIIRRRNLIF